MLDRGEMHALEEVVHAQQDRDRRDPSTDLGEDPDEIDREPVAGDERARDVRVVLRVRVGSSGMQRNDGQPPDQGEHVQDHGASHGRCSLAPGPGASDRYQMNHRAKSNSHSSGTPITAITGPTCARGQGGCACAR